VRRGTVLMGLALLVLAVGCRRSNTSVGAGARTPQQAVVQFLDAARAQDMDQMSAVWGNDESPTRDRVERQELERRLLIMICHLKHDESRLAPAQMGEAGRMLLRADLKQGTKETTVPFTLVRNPRTDMWFVEDVDLRPAREFCTPVSTTPSR
jgi:hypothetical protein